MIKKHLSATLLSSLTLLLLSSCYAETAKQPVIKLSSETIIKTRKNPDTMSDWKKLLNWPTLCDHGTSFFPEVDIYPWFEERQLVSIVCTTGAYNLGLMFYLETTKGSNQYTLLTFPQFREADEYTPDQIEKTLSGNLAGAPYYQYDIPLLWGTLHSDMSNHTITNEDRYRGGGGCGTITSYQIINNKIQVSKLRIREVCDETHPPISEWPEYAESFFSTWPKVILKENEW